MNINLNTGKGYKAILFPDNQPHIQITPGIMGDLYNVVCSITSSLKLINLLEVSNAIDHARGVKNVLIIPYLMAARYDRVMNEGDSFDLEIIAELINNLGFKRVELLDVHSDVAKALIKRSSNQSNYFLVDQYKQKDAILIVPDAGAVKKVDFYLKSNWNIKDVVYCNKTRELIGGNITLKVLEPEKCTDRNCVIIDDLCDGGNTFLRIAEQIKPIHLTLIVTHGIFSQGFNNLEGKFNEIIVSDSYQSTYNSNIVKVIKNPLT